MKKILFLLPMIALLAGCSGDNEATNNTSISNGSLTETSEVRNEEGDGRSLVAYFSLPVGSDTDANSGASLLIQEDGKGFGLTEQVAQWISEEQEADIFRIQTEEEFPDNVEDVISEADEDQAESYRPALASTINNLDQYDVIYLGYPNWWGDLPMAMYSFLEETDLSGKTIIPFNTHGGSGLSDTVSTIEELQPGATVESNALSISRGRVADSQAEVEEWLAEVTPK
ncbi:flavodoxin [Enterococcus sp. AZ109]|uniref:flavodoxin n=1 Tax=Enterococcus sp. AZ109 TaxID=2774634 RepID=UPI003F683CD9